MAQNDWVLPNNGTLYTDVLDNLKDLIHKTTTMMLGTDTDLNIPDNAIRWSVANNRFEIFDGISAWTELASNYAISVTKLNGQLSTYYTAAENMTGSNIPSGHIDNTSHGILGGASLHAIATTSSAGFLSASDKTKLNNLSILSDADIETAYNNRVPLAVATDTTTSVRRYSPAVLRDAVEDKLKTGTQAIVFNGFYVNTWSSTTNINVLNGNSQKLDLQGNTIITITQVYNRPYTMYLYIATSAYSLDLPSGFWEGGVQPNFNFGSHYIRLTINYSGSNRYYSALLDLGHVF